MTSDVEKWLAALPEKSIQDELLDLREQGAEIQGRIEVREQALAIKRSFSSENTPTEEDPTEREASDRAPAADDDRPRPGIRAVNPPFRGREAIRMIIKSTPNRVEWTIPDMLAAFHQRNWPANTHSVQVNLSRMHRDGELGKGGTGVYVVPQGEGENGRPTGTLDDFLVPNGGEGDGP